MGVHRILWLVRLEVLRLYTEASVLIITMIRQLAMIILNNLKR